VLSTISDAENRIRPEDQLIDAVIGLEAILLASVEDRTELKFRFALNYSTLASNPTERLNYFRTAKHLYDLRSKIAHGMKFTTSNVKIGNNRFTLGAAATKACEVLREVILRFLPLMSKKPYSQHSYWENKYFGLDVDS
jgi:hypothetical protein